MLRPNVDFVQVVTTFFFRIKIRKDGILRCWDHLVVHDDEQDFQLIVLPGVSHRDLNKDVNTELGWIGDEQSIEEGATEEEEERGSLSKGERSNEERQEKYESMRRSGRITRLSNWLGGNEDVNEEVKFQEDRDNQAVEVVRGMENRN